MKKAKTEEETKRAISDAFKQIEEEWESFSAVAFKLGFAKTAYVGSCALVALVVDDRMYVANSGDSKAVMLREVNDGFEAINVSTTFNANKK